MTPQLVEMILIVLGLVVQYGVPAVVSSINALGKDDITLEDIKNLKVIVKPPEEY